MPYKRDITTEIDMNAQLEHINDLSGDDQIAVDAAQRIAAAGKSLDDVEKHLRHVFFGWYVYRGGNHVALHRSFGAPRALLVTEV